MRSIPPSLDATVVAGIDARLDEVARREHVNVAWAVESGSRAWGFPSVDSDYDCRFLFIRSEDRYLSPWPERDVIETPLDAIFDVNGWDIVKAVRLAAKGNATVGEWLRSPIVYRGDERFRDALLELLERVTGHDVVGRHYLHVGLQKWTGGGDMPLKKVFYSLRPAAAIQWLRRHPAGTVPPMTLQQLLAESEAPAEVIALSEELAEQKAHGRELGVGTVPPAIARFIGEEFRLGHELYEHADTRIGDRERAVADAFFRTAVREFGA